MTTTEVQTDPLAGNDRQLLRLNLGCGGQVVEGWVNVDRSFDPAFMRGPQAMIVDLLDDVWPWDENTVDGIVIHHVLSGFTVDEMQHVLRHCARVLKPRAWLRVSDADLMRGIDAAMRGDVEWFAEKLTSEGYRAAPPDEFGEQGIDVERTLGHFILQGEWRKQLLLPFEFASACGHCGFDTAYSSRFHTPRGPEWMGHLDTRAGESWFAEAQK